MNETYFVSFQAGTGGRFIASIVWHLINRLDSVVEYSQYNSAHLNSYWALSWDSTSMNHTTTNYPDIYKEFRFTNAPSAMNPFGHGLLNTHTFPDFDVISSRFPKSKIVLVTYDVDDIPEICLNNVLKNGIEFFRSGPRIKTLYESMLFKIASKVLFSHYNEDIDVTIHNFTVSEVQAIFKDYLKTLKPYLETTQFLNPSIPKHINNETLTISYNELFTKTDTGFLGLDKLKGFTNTEISDTIMQSYTNYVNGREGLLEQYEIKRT